MRTYSLPESASLLGVDLATLRRWRAAAGGLGERGPADRRRAWLTRAELAALARAHGRLLVNMSPGEVAELAREVAQLRVEVAELRQQVQALEKSIHQ